jgi:hypothetical protein
MKLSRLVFIILKGMFFLVIMTSCEPAGLNPDPTNTPPKARFRIVPDCGDTTVAFVLDGHRSADSQDVSLWLKYRWDLNGDSIWDTEFVDYPYLIYRFAKPGRYTVRMEVQDRFGLGSTAGASVTTWGANSDTSHIVDLRDGQWYKTIRINGIWWMAENLNYGKLIQDTQLPADDDVAEKYCFQNDPSMQGESGGYFTYYDWNEVMNYKTWSDQGLCPPGWRVPTQSEWDTLIRSPLYRGLDPYFTEGGLSGLNLTRIGIHELTKPWGSRSGFWMYFTRDFQIEYYRGSYCPCPFVRSSWHFRNGNDNGAMIRFVNDSIRKNGGALPVRCVK